MTRLSESQSVMVYDPRLQNPPSAFIFMEMLHDFITMELSITHPLHPHQIYDMIADLLFMYSTMDYLDDWSLFKRVQTLLSRARVKAFQGCLEIMQRCAVLVDDCRRHQLTPSSAMPSYVTLELAVVACDDVLHYLLPTMKQFYVMDLRPSLIAFMCDSESDSDSDSDGQSAIKHARAGDPQ